MRFKRSSSTLASLVLLLAISACGEKKPAERTLLSGNEGGCYDQLSDRVSRYFEGSIEKAEWQATFDCVHDQVTFFKKYVRGNSPAGYNQEDIAALIRKFLIVNRPVSDQFVASIFEIKASVFGGAPTVITPKEIDEFLKLSEILRVETTDLLPHLQAKRRDPSGANLLGLSDHLGFFGKQLAQYLKTLRGTVSVRKESFVPFVREILALHGGDPTLVDRYGDFVRNLKVVVSGGSPDVIEASNWAALVEEGAAFGGLLFAYRDMENQWSETAEKNQFQIDLARRAQSTVNQVIRLHGGKIALSVFDPVIDTAPWSSLTPEKRAALKHDLRPLISRTMKGGAPGWLTTEAVTTIFNLFEEGTRKQIHLKKIYKNLSDSPTTQEFESAARSYRFGFNGVREREEVNALIEIAKSYVGLFSEDSGEMVFTNAVRTTRSQNHMIRMSWYRLLMQHLFSVYATGPEVDLGRKSAQTSDLTKMIEDFNQILLEWKLSPSDLTAQEMAGKRFREANLFMPSSNGDAYMDDVEGTYYLGFLFSSGSFSGRVFRSVTQNSRDWSACPIVGVDDLKQDAVEASCFRKTYFGHPEIFWTNYPALQAAYAKMTDAERIDLARSMEVAARRGGYSEKPIGPYDVDSFSALPHYVEDIMERFDVNGDEALDKREILDHAYPIFKETLSKAARGIKSDFLLKGILTYIIRYGKAPPSTLSLLGWCAKLSVTNVIADRPSLYRVVALLSSPLDLEKNTTGTSWPLGENDLFPIIHSQ